jgi:hypothetical protein
LYFKPKQENEFAVEVLVVVVEAVVLVVAGAEERGDVALEIESLGVDCVTIVVLVVVADVVTRVGVSVLGRLTLEVVALAWRVDVALVAVDVVVRMVVLEVVWALVVARVGVLVVVRVVMLVEVRFVIAWVVVRVVTRPVVRVVVGTWTRVDELDVAEVVVVDEAADGFTVEVALVLWVALVLDRVVAATIPVDEDVVATLLDSEADAFWTLVTVVTPDLVVVDVDVWAHPAINTS